MSEITSPHDADAVKETLQKITSGLVACGFSDAELDSLEIIRRTIAREVVRFAKNGKPLKGSFYAAIVKSTLSELRQSKSARIPNPEAVQTKSPSQIPSLVPSQPPDQAMEPLQAEAAKIRTSFPTGSFLLGDPLAGGAQVSVLELDELTKRFQLLEKSVANLNVEMQSLQKRNIYVEIATVVVCGILAIALILRWARSSSRHGATSRGANHQRQHDFWSRNG